MLSIMNTTVELVNQIWHRTRRVTPKRYWRELASNTVVETLKGTTADEWDDQWEPRLDENLKRLAYRDAYFWAYRCLLHGLTGRELVGYIQEAGRRYGNKGILTEESGESLAQFAVYRAEAMAERRSATKVV